MDEIRRRLRAGGGAIDRRSNRDLTGAIDRMLRTGDLIAPLPATYCLAADHDNTDVRLRAVALWAGPDAIFTGRIAATLTYWRDCPPGAITLVTPSQGRRSRPGIEVETRLIAADLVCTLGAIRVTAVSLTATDLAGSVLGGEPINRALRTRTATLDQMWDAVLRQPHRRGNARRARFLRESCSEPWSEAERLLHRLLRARRLTGCSANAVVRAADVTYFADVLYPREQVILEVDGWQTHGSRAAFEDDRRRRNHLVMAGFAVLNFTRHQLTEDADWVAGCIRSALGR